MDWIGLDWIELNWMVMDCTMYFSKGIVLLLISSQFGNKGNYILFIYMISLCRLFSDEYCQGPGKNEITCWILIVYPTYSVIKLQ